MLFNWMRELSHQIRRKYLLVLCSLLIIFTVAYVYTYRWKSHSIIIHQAVMSKIDVIILNEQKPFLTFVIPIIVFVIFRIIDGDETIAMVIKRKSREQAWLVCCFKTILICLLYATVYVAFLLAISNAFRLSTNINWQDSESIYFSANHFTTERFSFWGLTALSFIYIFFTVSLFAMVFQLIRVVTRKSYIGIIVIIVIVFNEAWGLPILGGYSGMYHIHLTEQWNAIRNLGAPALATLILVIIGFSVARRREFLNDSQKR